MAEKRRFRVTLTATKIVEMTMELSANDENAATMLALEASRSPHREWMPNGPEEDVCVAEIVDVSGR